MIRVLTVTMLAMAHSVLLDIGGVASVPVSITVGRLLVTNARQKENKRKPVTSDKATDSKKQEIKTERAPLVVPKTDIDPHVVVP